MKSKFEIFHGKHVVGIACIGNEGLYYRIQCTCQLPQNGIYRVFVEATKRSYNLGVCIPKGNALIIDTKVPISRLGSDNFKFYIVSQNPDYDTFYPVQNQKPFPKIEILRNGFFTYKAGIAGIELKMRDDSSQNNL